MVVAYAANGGVTSAAGQTVAPTYPAGIAAGDGLILTRMARSDATVLVTPSGWTLLDERTGGTGVFGNDTGPLRLARYWREATGTESGTVVCDTSPGTADVQQAVITRYTKTGTTWDVAASGGSDNTASVDWSVTAAANPGITTGDVIEVALSWPTDAARVWSSEVLSATGATITAGTVPIVSMTTTLGADGAIRAHAYSCTAGTASAAPTYAATVNSATNVAGPTSMVRLREVTSGVSGPLAATLPAMATSATAALAAAGTLASTLPTVVVALTSSVTLTGQLAATLPAAEVSLSSGGTGIVPRPFTGIVTRPFTGIVERP